MRDLPATGGNEGVKKWGFVAMHAAVAATFMFLLQRFTMNASQETSLLWALTFAVCAAGLAYKQANR
jgi:hypothetical protein